MQGQRTIKFKIDSMDSLGQGVSKETDKITFIPKTLPGETGLAQIKGAKKGVQFAQLKELQSPSPQRINPLCPHFAQCPSCHYLHTTYEEEIKFKEKNLAQLLQKISHPPIQVTPAIRRSHYRNRLQLHYDLRLRKLGMLDVKNHTIVPIPQCIIGQERVLEEVKKLYFQDSWVQVIGPGAPIQGHIEIYEQEEKVKITANRPYAEGGFSQVFEEMNQILKDTLLNWAQKFTSKAVLDLFAGNGNLSNGLNYSQRLCIDSYSHQVSGPFYSQDLYGPKALENVRNKLESIQIRPSLMLLDPPRSGLKNLDSWLEAFCPEKVAYISCDPHTLARDIRPLKGYKVSEVHLVDFFPSTFHFETMIFLERI